MTQNIQWLLLMGISFVVSVFLQDVRGYNAIQTGVIFTAATARHPRLVVRRRAAREALAQRTLIIAGFVVTLAGIVLLLGFVQTSSRVVAFVPGLFLIGLGLGGMLTPSVNVVQSSFPEALQGEISGLSRAVSNLGSSFGTAIAGTILVSVVAPGNRSYAVAMIVLVGFGLSASSRRSCSPGACEASPAQRPSLVRVGQNSPSPDGTTWWRDSPVQASPRSTRS